MLITGHGLLAKCGHTHTHIFSATAELTQYSVPSIDMRRHGFGVLKLGMFLRFNRNLLLCLMETLFNKKLQHQTWIISCSTGKASKGVVTERLQKGESRFQIAPTQTYEPCPGREGTYHEDKHSACSLSWLCHRTTSAGCN